jgi:hypothetical protein
MSGGRYQVLLAGRIEALMADSDPMDIRDLLSQLETQENLRLVDKANPAQILVECSQTLREMAQYPTIILPDEWELDSETEAALNRESAEDYLLALLR